MEIILDRVDFGHSVQIQCTLKVQVQAAEIEVDRTDYRAHIITDKHFGMDEARCVLIDLHACFHQPFIIGMRQRKRIFFVRDVRQDEFDIYTAPGRVF